VEAAQKDPTRFAELYEINFERVYAFIAWRVGDRDAAEDLTSEVFHKALASLRRFEWRGAPFASWLLRIAANAIADQAQRGRKEFAVADPPEIAEARLSLSRSRKWSVGRGYFVWSSSFPEEQRRVIAMRFAEEKSIREIAEKLAVRKCGEATAIEGFAKFASTNQRK